MWPLATDVARSVSVCVLVTRMFCAKSAEPIEMPFEGPTPLGPRNHVLDKGHDRANHSQLRGVTVSDAVVCQMTLDTCSLLKCRVSAL